MEYVILEFLDDYPLLDNDTVLQSFETKKTVKAGIMKIAKKSPNRYDWRYHICVNKIKSAKSNPPVDRLGRTNIAMIYHKEKITEFRDEREVMDWFQEKIKCGDFSKTD